MSESVIQWHPPTHSVPPSAKSAVTLDALPPLSLYVHIPWCVRKCPYCDFNSHELARTAEGDWERAYIDALVADLDATLPLVWGRRLVSVFIGGGTPSVLSERALDELLGAIRARLPSVADLEITMEANPGTLDKHKLRGYRQAGITRLSIGVQSFDDGLLQNIGRIHNAREAHAAIEVASRLFERVNIDLMYALPTQTLAQLQSDVAVALSHAPSHLSYYHLTIEPNTYFHRHPPVVPDDELATDMQLWIEQALAAQGLRHYEVSAYARAGQECQHNTNYWQFGDYIGIGAGAHGKISFPDRIVRTTKFKHPQAYMKAVDKTESEHTLTRDDLAFEYMLNALRLRDGTTTAQMQTATGLSVVDLEPALSQAQTKGLMDKQNGVLRTTELGWRFLSEVQSMFLR